MEPFPMNGPRVLGSATRTGSRSELPSCNVGASEFESKPLSTGVGAVEFRALIDSMASSASSAGSKHEWALLQLRVRGIEQVRLYADLTILAKLACALAKTRVWHSGL